MIVARAARSTYNYPSKFDFALQLYGIALVYQSIFSLTKADRLWIAEKNGRVASRQ